MACRASPDPQHSGNALLTTLKWEGDVAVTRIRENGTVNLSKDLRALLEERGGDGNKDSSGIEGREAVQVIFTIKEGSYES
jgi:hypothetical protein